MVRASAPIDNRITEPYDHDLSNFVNIERFVCIGWNGSEMDVYRLNFVKNVDTHYGEK